MRAQFYSRNHFVDAVLKVGGRGGGGAAHPLQAAAPGCFSRMYP